MNNDYDQFVKELNSSKPSEKYLLVFKQDDKLNYLNLFTTEFETEAESLISDIEHSTDKIIENYCIIKVIDLSVYTKIGTYNINK